MPPFMTSRTKKGLRPAIGLISKEVPRRPMMVFCAIGAAYFALVAWVARLNLAHLEARS